MKIAALVSVVAAGRQARDATQSLFNKMLGDHNDNVEQRNFIFSETDSLYQIMQFYLQTAGKRFEIYFEKNFKISENFPQKFRDIKP